MAGQVQILYQQRHALTVQVYLKAGFPLLQRSGFLQNLQSWLQRVGATTDFQYIMLSAMFLPQQSVSLVSYVLTASLLLHMASGLTVTACCFYTKSQIANLNPGRLTLACMSVADKQL